MRRAIIWIPLLLLVVAAAALLLGPRVEVDTRLEPVQLPADLDAYLQESEAQFADIVPGAEKTIVWAGEPGEKTAPLFEQRRRCAN